ncbi:hypothetical protein A5713_24690 [Mycobacterium sp. E2497]|nr:hypothetical protein A5713_24690 [Mycobacterium sp. E2497]
MRDKFLQRADRYRRPGVGKMPARTCDSVSVVVHAWKRIEHHHQPWSVAGADQLRCRLQLMDADRYHTRRRLRHDRRK